MTDLLAIGETMALVAPAGPEPLLAADAFTITAAGAESNVAMWVAQLGLSARWLSRLGDDALGRRVRAAIEAAGVDVDMTMMDPTSPTGVFFKDPSRNGTHVLYYRRGSAASRLNVGDLTRAGAARIVHVTGITPALSTSCADLVSEVLRARDRFGMTSFDVNYRPQLWAGRDAAPVLRELADRADIIFVGRDEAEELWGWSDARRVRAELPGPRLVVVKDGAAGATVMVRGEHPVFVPALSVEVVELVGAGDAFAAGFLTGMLRGVDLQSACLLGHRLAARAISSTSDNLLLTPTLSEETHVLPL